MSRSWMIRLARPFPLFSFVLLTATGCQMDGRTDTAAAPREAPAVAIDKRDNGAAIQVNHRFQSEPPPARRAFQCEISGTSRPPAGPATPEQRAAAIQAAVVDGLFRAILEERADSGETSAGFFLRISPRLTLNHEIDGQSSIVRLTLLTGGTETIFETRDGALTHAPHDVHLVNRLFESTNGRYSLLGAEWSPAQDACVARVGCYAVAAAPTLAGDARRADGDAP